MPDFIIESPNKFYVEAVVANIKATGESEDERTLEDTLRRLEPIHLSPSFSEIIDEAIVRYSNAISLKNEKYKNEYSSKDWIEQDKPFTLALASYDQINYGVEFIYPMMALLYGMNF